MSGVRWDPFRETNDLQRAINRLFDSRFSETSVVGFPVDVYETPTELVVRADLPGVQPDRIRVQHHNGQIYIRAARTAEAPEDASWLLRQTPEGEMVRALSISVPVDVERVSASYDAGVVELHLPKAEHARPREIRVVAGGPQRRNAPQTLPPQGPTPGPADDGGR